jgi:hypothetical protein
MLFPSSALKTGYSVSEKYTVSIFSPEEGDSMKTTVLWDVVSDVLAASIIRAIALMMEAANISETSADFHQTTRRNNPEDSHLLSLRRDNFKSQGGSMFFFQNVGVYLQVLTALVITLLHHRKNLKFLTYWVTSSSCSTTAL